MGWEKRGFHSYYYSATRQNGRVVRRYWGRGLAGIAGQSADVLDKRDRVNARDEARHNEKARAAAIIDPLREIESGVRSASNDLFLEASRLLTAAGYHRGQNRGQWRKKRGAKMETKSGSDNEQTALVQAAREKAEQQFFVCGVMSTNEKDLEPGDEEKALRLFKESPADFVGFTRAGKSLPGILSMMQANQLHRKMLAADVDAKRAELTGPNPTPVESLLIERVLACWLFVHYLEDSLALMVEQRFAVKSIQNIDKMLNSANKRYMQALKTLAQVQRLKIPVNVQVNVATAGGQQVNIS